MVLHQGNLRLSIPRSPGSGASPSARAARGGISARSRRRGWPSRAPLRGWPSHLGAALGPRRRPGTARPVRTASHPQPV